MESIVLLVLFGIASSIFQAFVKSNKQQKQKAVRTERVMPKAEPIKEVKRNVYVEKDLEMYPERKQVEVIKNIVVPEQKEEPSSSPRFTWMDDITFDDLERSIVMAEVLGKPKALRKAER